VKVTRARLHARSRLRADVFQGALRILQVRIQPSFPPGLGHLHGHSVVNVGHRPDRILGHNRARSHLPVGPMPVLEQSRHGQRITAPGIDVKRLLT